jgi:hypothetical protein
VVLSFRYATASARSDGLLLLCGGRDGNSVVCETMSALLYTSSIPKYMTFYMATISNMQLLFLYENIIKNKRK